MAIAAPTAGSRILTSDLAAFYNLLKGVTGSGETITLIYNAAGVISIQPSSDPAAGTQFVQIKNNAGTVKSALTSDGGAVYSARIHEAKGADIASATALTPGVDGNYFHVTGTTTVTSIATAQAGSLLVLEFDGAVLLTHNATSLILTGAANYTTAAGDVLMFISEGSGNWREINRTTSGASFAAPALTLGTANSAGVASTAIRTDATILAFDATTPAATAVAGAVGSATTASRRDHVHATSMTMITDTLLGSSAATIDFTSIPATYKHLVIEFQGRCDVAAASDNLDLRMNNDSGANYNWAYADQTSTVIQSGSNSTGTTTMRLGLLIANTGTANRATTRHILIPNYAGTTFHKNVQANGVTDTGNAANNALTHYSSGAWLSTVAISRITLLPASVGNFIAGTRATLYGLS